MSSSIDYQKAYERQKIARARAEELLETRSRELFDANQALNTAYEELKSQKAQTLHQEKLASLGQLVAGVAHEINNPNAFVKSNLSSLKGYQQSLSKTVMEVQSHLNQCSTDGLSACDLAASVIDIFNKNDVSYILEDLEDVVDESIEGAKRVEDIVLSLKNFSRQDSEKPENLDVNLCIENTLKLVISEVKYKAELILDLGDVPIVKGFPGAMSQVLMNLLVNASQAIEDFGIITITTRSTDRFLELKVTDTGMGISEKHINKIFDPFFTTKDVGVGTGLGLSIVHGIIDMHKGIMSIESEPGKGTTFTIQLPLTV